MFNYYIYVFLFVWVYATCVQGLASSFFVFVYYSYMFVFVWVYPTYLQGGQKRAGIPWT